MLSVALYHHYTPITSLIENLATKNAKTILWNLKKERQLYKFVCSIEMTNMKLIIIIIVKYIIQ